MFKTDHHTTWAPLQPHDVPEGPWHTNTLDLIGPLPKSQGYDAILTVIDKFTKKAFFIPTISTIMSLGLQNYIETMCSKNTDCQKKKISDRGTQFLSNFMKELQEMLKIQWNPSMAYQNSKNI